MKRFLGWLFGAIFVVILLLVAVPFFIPTGVLTEKVIELVKVYTGRDLVINGETHLKLLPKVELAMSNVTFSGMEGGKYDQMVVLDDFAVQVALVPLFSGSVDIEKFILTKPVISLETNKKGKGNWEFEPETVAEAKKTAPEEVDRAKAVQKGNPLAGISMHGVEITDAVIRFADGQTGAVQQVDGINIAIGHIAPAHPFEAKIGFSYNGRPVTSEITISDLEKFLLKEAVEFSALAEAKNVTFKANGEIKDPVQNKTLILSSSLKANNLNDLAKWAGQTELGLSDKINNLSYTGTLSASQTKVGLSKAEIRLGEMIAKGNVSADISKSKPYVNANLSLNQLNISDFSSETSEQTTSASSKKSGGKAQPIVWSKDPIDLSALSLLDADAVLKVGRLILPDLEITNAQIQAGLKNSVLNASLSSDPIFNGTVASNVTVNASAATPSYALKTDIKNLAMGETLKQLADYDKLTGNFDGVISLTTTGNSVDAIVKGLNGDGRVSLRDGILHGLDVAASVNRSQSNQDPTPRETDKTEFKDMAMSFLIRNSVLITEDLKIKAKYVDIPAKGKVGIYAQNQDVRAEPTLNSEYKGKGQMLVDVPLPLAVKGTWYDPEVAVGLDKVIMKVIGNQVENVIEVPGDAVKGILKGGESLGKGLLNQLK